MEIYLVRHPEKEKGVINAGLTKRGLVQSKYLAKKLKGEKFEEFYCSDSNRTKQAAKIISKKLKLVPKIDSRLNEFSLKDSILKKGKWGEKEAASYEGLKSFFKEILINKLENKKVLILSHGITNRIIVATLLDIGFRNIIRMSQYQASINILKWNYKFHNWRLTSWNDVSYLPPKLRIEE